MTYQETINWMFSQLPMYQRKGKTAFKADLSNILNLTEHLGHPERQIRMIHVGGTNGKGSTSHMITSVLQEAGYKVGLYTSPHLKNYTERIKINGEEIERDFVVDFISQNKPFLEANSLSFFEMTVGLAFSYFKEKEVDFAVIEVGLGGRLDSTNVIEPEISVITNIGKDHVQFLGDTLPLIAGEKAGIIKENTPVVIGEYQEEVFSVFEEKAKEVSADLHLAEREVQGGYTTDLLGSYQQKNMKTAVRAIQVLRDKEVISISEEQLKCGLQHVVQNTGLKGRWQILQESSPKIICDTAHNKEGLFYTLKQLSEEPYENLHIVLGFVNDKSVEEVLALFPKDANYYFCRPDIPRGLDVEILVEKAANAGIEGTAFNSVTEAKEAAISNAKEKDVIYIGGSTFVVAEVI
ncbi:bifunctional folylpolyglutamate synthase/dihydrofolate synthase [Aureivirga sp. CE67]|uniref:bifunctional folylpolyglutamate synthase/dihydrofolate synthase n=1 Tax=Aureivirga sp. CE67 TaxID=1788983 RepID=UPI0018CA14E8|nr:folylpolyglutamate synthase/dihydrofolate synthase family protein [Aureivirga sp. CE67]